VSPDRSARPATLAPPARDAGRSGQVSDLVATLGPGQGPAPLFISSAQMEEAVHRWAAMNLAQPALSA